ncbi:BID domain-containing T4SS effector [Bartonella sp. B1098]|uniref:BID domain-containing T4SS effector n=1 Tax=Bartonella sp. B1098 TaxID=2911421 RepID=UPI0020C232C6|nr:BID domain-containing T4SS effector [Bartonella sp. B1098]
MKKHHPHPSANPEALYATVNKQNRGNQRSPIPEEEVLYASVSTVSPLSRGRHHNQRHQESETDYTTVAPPRREEEVTYASVSSVSPSRAGRHQQRLSESETDYTEVSPQQRGRAPLTADKMTVQLLKTPKVQAYAEEVVYWSKIVYGQDNILQQHLQDILTNPSKGKELSDQLAENPETIHKLAGRSALGMKTQTRKAAEEGFRPLVDALDGYTNAVKETRDRLLQTPHAEQRRQKELSQQTERAHHRHHHTRGQEQNSPEHSPHRQRHGMAYAM